MNQDPIEWSSETFLQNGEKVLKAAAAYHDSLRQKPVAGFDNIEDLAELLAVGPPQEPEAFDAILADTVSHVVPALVHWNHPRFHGYFSTSGSYPGALAELFAANLNVNAMLWHSAPGAAMVEAQVLRWINEMVEYFPEGNGVLVPGASLGTFYALVAARDRLLPNVQEHGYPGNMGGGLRIYVSDQAHSSVDKAASALGVGRANVVRIRSDSSYRMSASALEEAIDEDIRSGVRPLAVVATVGTTATGAVDPVEEVALICKERGIWLHIDAAYGGFWRLAPQLGAKLPSLRYGESMVVNPHKVLFASLESSCLFCRDPDALETSFRVVPDYLHTPESGEDRDYMNQSLQLGRSFSALKLWWIIRSYGLEGIRSHYERLISSARWLEHQVDSSTSFWRPAESPYPLITLRYGTGDRKDPALAAADLQRTEQLLNRVNTSGRAFLSHAGLRDGYAIRVSLGNIRTTHADVEQLWCTIQEVGTTLDEDNDGPAPPRPSQQPEGSS